MNQILLRPTDVLFFRDGRPMSGSLAGHGAAWPLPNVISAAFHAALHRAFPEPNGDHLHRVKVDGGYSESRTRRFGSLVTAGPFPVRKDGAWFFPRPADLLSSTLEPTLLPAISDWADSCLPKPLQYAVGSILPPAKETKAKLWLSGGRSLHRLPTSYDDVFLRYQRSWKEYRRTQRKVAGSINRRIHSPPIWVQGIA